MAWIEILIAFPFGLGFWWLSCGKYPVDPQRRQNFERALPWVKNKLLLRGMAGFIWLFGGVAAADRYFDLGLSP